MTAPEGEPGQHRGVDPEVIALAARLEARILGTVDEDTIEIPRRRRPRHLRLVR